MADTADNLPKGFNENPFCKSPTHKTVLLFRQLFFLRHASMEIYATRYCQRNECFCGCFPYDGKWMHLADNALGFDAVVHWQLTCSQLKATVGIRYRHSSAGWVGIMNNTRTLTCQADPSTKPSAPGAMLLSTVKMLSMWWRQNMCFVTWSIEVRQLPNGGQGSSSAALKPWNPGSAVALEKGAPVHLEKPCKVYHKNTPTPFKTSPRLTQTPRLHAVAGSAG